MMDSSPRPLRRFSRWQTTKRTFVLGGVAYKPENTNKILQGVSETSEIAKKKTKKVNAGKNGKIQKEFLNYSTADSAAELTRQSSPEITKPTFVRRLCLDTPKRTKDTKANTVTAKAVQPVNKISHDVPIVSDNVTFSDERLHHITCIVSLEKSKNSVEADPSLFQGVSQCERLDCGNDDVSDKTSHQNNKYALSDISQNTSADKPATIQTGSSQTKGHGATHSVHEASIVPDEVNRCKRQAVDDGESSDTSGTDKENKDKDPSNTDITPPVKKLKQDGTAQHVSTPRTNNKSVGDLNVSRKGKTLKLNNEEGAVLSPRRSSLRNRDLLVSATTLMKSRQYPVFLASEIKSLPDKSLSNGKEKSSIKTKSAVKKVADKRQSSQLEIKSKHKNSIRSARKKILVHKNESPIKGKDVDISNHEFSKHKGSTHKITSKNTSVLEKSTTIRKASGFSSLPATDKQINSTHFPEISSSRRSGLRDRSVLLTPEEMQNKRQYPISFFFSSRRSSVGSNEHSNPKQTTAKRKQKISVHNKEIDPSSSSSKTLFIDLHLTNNRNTNCVSSTSKSASSRGCSLTSSNFLISSHATSKELSHERKTRKMSKKLHGTETVAKSVNCKNVNMKVQAISRANFPDRTESKISSCKHIKKILDLESEASASKVQSKLKLTSLPSDRTCVVSNNDNSQVRGQKTFHATSTENADEENHVESRIKDARASIVHRKSPASKAKRLYSLPRRHVKKSSNEECSTTAIAEGSRTSSTNAHISSQSLQLSTTIVDTSWKRSQKLACRKPSVKSKSKFEPNTAQTRGKKQVIATRPKMSVSETVVVSQKQPRKRKLLEELNKAGQTVNSEEEHQEVFLWHGDGLSRKVSDVTAFDVILKAVMDVEEKLLNEAEDGSIEHRLVRKVMGKLKRNIKPMISEAVEVKKLQREIRQQNSRIRQLMADIKDQQKKIVQFRSEMHESIGSDEDVNLVRVGEFMKGYNQLMQAYANISR